MRRALFYTLKVWLTSALAGSLTFMLVMEWGSFNLIDMLGVTLYGLGLSLLFSLPSAAILWFFVLWFMGFSGTVALRKALLSVLGVVLSILALLLLHVLYHVFDADFMTECLGIFCPWIIVSIWFYRWPQNTTVPQL